MFERIVECLKCLKELLLYYLLFPIAILLYGHKDIWVISERGNDARDNGYHFYKYLRTSHPKINAYYVISSNSADYLKIAPLGNIVEHGSLKHYLLFIAAKYKISTHIMGFSPNVWFYCKFLKIIFIYGNMISLKHGITKDDLPSIYAEKTKLSLLIAGARPEYEYMSENFHYAPGVIQYTGFARYDNLINQDTKNQILFMPTWRMFLLNLDKKEINQSEYVSKWNALINNVKLSNYISKKGIQLVFYPHYEMQKHIEMFKSANPNIIIASFDDYDVQQLLIESKLLVTDYSSVFFDFAYMGKPCLYYQFDREKFFSEHYKKGYFDYDTMGFGLVCPTEEMIVEEIIKIAENKFYTSEKYKERINTFFPLRDKNNCRRIFEAIKSI